MMICPASHTRNPHLNSSIIFWRVLRRGTVYGIGFVMVSEQCSED